MKTTANFFVFASLLIIWFANPVLGDIINVPTDQATIQAAIDIANPGDEIIIASGTYNEILNIENKTDIALSGISPTIIGPTSALAWDVGGYGSSRWAGIRIVNSAGILVNDIDFDFDVIKANTVTGVLMWNSEVTLTTCSFENMSASDVGGQYTEVTTYVRAPDYSDAVRALITFDGCTFMETGRLGILAGDFVHIEINNCHFEKTIADFGYAMEIGSDATANVTGCIITGYNTPAASDGSASSGIYIENSYTSDVTSAITKNVTIDNNFIYNNQWGMYIGNSFAGLSGDVDIVVALTNNLLFGNVKGGLVVTDEGAYNGSSVTVTSSHNDLVGNKDGYYLFTYGNGDLTVHLADDTIEGHDNGLILYDNTVETGSSYDIMLRDCHIFDSWSNGIINVHGVSIIDARYNFWGDNSGPSGVGPGTGDPVSNYVDFFPWIGGDPSCCGAFSEGVSGNVDRSEDGRNNLADITLLIDRVYVSKTPLVCEPDGNADGSLDGTMNLSDITRLIDAVYVSKLPPEDCLPYTTRVSGVDGTPTGVLIDSAVKSVPFE